MNEELLNRYRHWRRIRPELTAREALGWARAELRYREVRDLFGEWRFDESAGYGTFAHAECERGGYRVQVCIGDDDIPLDWGDCEPTDEEREAARPYYVAVRVLDASGGELYHDGIGGVDVIDLPGYLQRDWEDAAAYALDEYLLDGAERFARNEDRERAEWEARDVMTV